MGSAWQRLTDGIKSIFFAGTSQAGYAQARDDRQNVGRPAGAGGDYSLEQGEDRLILLEKARVIERQYPLAQALLDRLTDLVIGTGIKPQAQTENKQWNDRAEKLFDQWACDEPELRKIYSFYEAQRILCRCFYRDGDIFIIRLKSGQFQLVEADRVHAPLGWEYRPFHVAGIDIDSNGAPKAYYIVPMRPNDHYIVRPYDYPERTRVSAEFVQHIARRTRPTQTRGVSVFSGSLNWFEHLSKYVEAVAINARISACAGILISNPLPFTGAMGTTTTQGGRNSPAYSFEPGMVMELMPGQTVTPFTPSQPQTQFGEFLKAVTRQIGLPAGLPLEILSMDFSNANYSVARAAFMLATRSTKPVQDLIIGSMLRPIWKWKIAEFIRDGRLRDRQDKFYHRWLTPSMGWIDPSAEVQSTLAALDGGLTTYTKVLAEHGMDFYEMVASRKAENEALAKAGLRLSRSSTTREDICDKSPSQQEPPSNLPQPPKAETPSESTPSTDSQSKGGANQSSSISEE